MWNLGIFNNFQKFQVCGNIISAQISQKNDRLKSANFRTLIYERTHIYRDVIFWFRLWIQTLFLQNFYTMFLNFQVYRFLHNIWHLKSYTTND